MDKKKKRLSLAVIVDTALTLLDEAGIEGVTTRAIAARLNVKSASLYWHIKNKQTLFSHMAEAMFMTNLPDPAIREQSWQAWLVAGAHCIRNAALSHRDGARVIAASRPGSIDVLSFPAMIKRLEDAGFNRPQALNAFLVMGRYTLGWALAEQMEGGPDENRTEAGVGYEFGLEIIVRGLEETLGYTRGQDLSTSLD